MSELKQGHDLEENTITFSLKNSEDIPEEVMRIAQGSFFWKGERIDDIHKIYERFNEWLTCSEKADNK